MGSTSRVCLLLGLSVVGCASTDPPVSTDAFVPIMTVRDLATVDLASPDLARPPDLMPTCMTTGAPCMTGQQGVCASGHQGCVGGSSTCVQDTNPSVESCFNDLDDDCNGIVNNGCPIGVSLGTPRAISPAGGAGGGAASVRCPANTWVVHAQFYFDFADETASGVHIWCAAPTLSRGATSYTFTLGAEMAIGGWTGTVAEPYGEVSCGTAGAVAGWRTRGQAGTYVWGIGMYCASATLTLSAANQVSVNWALNGVGNYWSYPYPSEYILDCAPNEVLVGFDGRRGSWMDQIQPICAPLVFSYKP